MARHKPAIFLALLLSAILLMAAAEPGKLEIDREGSLPIYIDGLLSARAFKKGDSMMVPLEAICSMLDYTCSFSEKDGVLNTSIGDITLNATAGDGYIVADGRYLYAPEGWLLYRERLYLPHDVIERIFCIDAETEDGKISFSTDKSELISGGSDYYDSHFTQDDIYWLSRIIAAEAGSEPLSGKIAVGNVVLNRVESPSYPETVKAVVYDEDGIFQFQPALFGSVTRTPDEQSLIATYLCLEGWNVVGDSLYFVNPAAGSDWFDRELELVAKIGNHNFYRAPR